MTPADVRALLRDLPGAWPPLSDATALLRALEDAADAQPADAPLAAGVRAAHALATCDQDLPTLVGGVRRDHLVRWDTWTTTWIGTDVASGRRAMVRALRPSVARDPVARRSLRRAARALGVVDAHVRWVEHPVPALHRALTGAPLDPHPEGPVHADAVIRLLATGLHSLGRWEAAGLITPRLDDAEWDQRGDVLTVACLTPGHPGEDPRDTVSALARDVQRWASAGGTTAIDGVLSTLVSVPPERVEEAASALRLALAGALARTRHHLERTWRVLRVRDEHDRLQTALRRLSAAVVPPVGRGAVGIDMSGRICVVESDGAVVKWLAIGGESSEIRDAQGILAPREARRLLRARAAAPPNPRLQAQVGGDEAFTEAVCRWVASAHHLRTLTLLIEAYSP